MPSRLAHRPGWWRQSAITGWREYLARNPLRVTALTLLPRAILQTTFLVLLADLTSGPVVHQGTVVGATALTVTLNTMVGIADVPGSDKWSGTFWRIRSGRLAPFTVFVMRSWPYPFIGFCTSIVTLMVVAPFGLRATARDVFILLPCFALLALTTSAAGLAGAAFAVGRRADVLVGNLLMYLTLLGSGAVIPAGRLGAADILGSLLPMRHGLAAIRAGLAGRSFGGQLAMEAVVGTGWFLVAWALVSIQVYRARAAGDDDYS